ncbi:hypothetical protein J4212_02285 [Candidatus Woesearchaeota archaeon]|nr:hypothetical protein [Candidatus Woesearchaeota archaeon]
MRTLDTYIGIEPFAVLVDNSPQLSRLAGKARKLKSLLFPERLGAVKSLALGAMVNAYEGMMQAPEVGIPEIDSDGELRMTQGNLEEISQFEDIVFNRHPLSYALEKKAGCCRYQSALFFVLGYEADLGDKHFIQVAPVNPRVNTAFNEVIQGGQSHLVSIFRESLKDQSLDYARQNPRLFEHAFKKLPGCDFFSYHRAHSGLVLVSNPSSHVEQL